RRLWQLSAGGGNIRRLAWVFPVERGFRRDALPSHVRSRLSDGTRIVHAGPAVARHVVDAGFFADVPGRLLSVAKAIGETAGDAFESWETGHHCQYPRARRGGQARR